MNILVRNLSKKTTEEELAALFSPYGEIGALNLVYDAKTGLSKGFGFIEMPDTAAAKKAIKMLNGRVLWGSSIRVKEARGK